MKLPTLQVFPNKAQMTSERENLYALTLHTMQA